MIRAESGNGPHGLRSALAAIMPRNAAMPLPVSIPLLRRGRLVQSTIWRRIPALRAVVSRHLLAPNACSREAIDYTDKQPVSAGRKPLETPYKTGQGDYPAFIANPAGHPWESAHDPSLSLADDMTPPSAPRSVG